jgi:hypothetical protein
MVSRHSSPSFSEHGRNCVENGSRMSGAMRASTARRRGPDRKWHNSAVEIARQLFQKADL